MRYASVCDGIGAVHVAWQPLGWHCEWTAEIDAFPAAVVEQRWGFPNRGDMTRFRDWGDLDVDLLVGGTPCQAFSVAGLRRSLEDERGNLSLVFVNLMDAIDEERKRLGKPPAICVWENVTGVLSTKDNAFGCFLAGLAGEGVPLQPSGGKWSNAGYVLGPKRAVAWRVLDAQYFGVAQRRRRVFLVASARDGFSPAAVLFEPEGLRRDHAPSRAKGERASCPIAGCSNGGGANGPGRTADDADSLIPIWRRGDQANSEHCHGHAGTLNCDKGQQGGIVAYGDAAPIAFGGQMSTPQVNVDLSQTLQRKNPQAVAQPVTFDWQAGGGGTDTSFRGKSRSYIVDKPGCSRALTSCKTLAVAFSAKDHGGDASEEVAPTMRSMGHDGSHANGGGQLAVAVGTDLYNGAVDGDVAHSVRVGNGNAMGGVPSVMQAQGFTHSGYSNKPAWITGDRTDCLPSSGHGDTSHQGIGVMTPVGVDFQNCANTGDVSGTLMGEAQKKGGEAGHGVMQPLAVRTAQTSANGHGVAEGICHTLDQVQGQAVMTPMAVRRLTPMECERLQGFPDHYTAITYRKKPAADGPRYKALGNSMAVPVMAWIGQRIAKCALH